MAKTPADFVFFWKPDQPYGWAGQWYPSPFTARVTLHDDEERDVFFPTAEHWMMAQKALLFGDKDIFERIAGPPLVSGASTSPNQSEGAGPRRSKRSRPSKTASASPAQASPKKHRAPSPKEVKALGRKVKNFDEATWVRERTRIVLEGTLHKFRQNPDLRRELLATGEKEMVEASPLDRVWGIGMGEKKALETCGSAEGREAWGLNLLGRALGEAREVLRAEFRDEGEGEDEGEGIGGGGVAAETLRSG
ncbi:hypothetical protein BD309DRAFT_968350 [Dichomitus squalens]|uniref:NADAR domain-containing protein n=1 Tax=Dichomitus squalens TaxID=114155 RepID=A0A4Q9NFW3_9APHY|nr:hypothetical protein BD309DRAFT_968350 [Dichomitus squalens]TBU53910.1 hypothetical protein BD310DRAFT_937120 [Dichomitus squalens]